MKIPLTFPIEINVHHKNVDILYNALVAIRDAADPSTKPEDMIFLKRFIDQLERAQLYLMQRKRDIEDAEQAREESSLVSKD